MRGISKSFDGVRVLTDVDFEVRRGEVHALAGGNGAGKSTLMKILQGVYSLDAGEIEIDGRPVQLSSIQDARAAGIGMVFQEFSLVPTLTVAQNISLGVEPLGRMGLIRDREAARRAREVFAEMGVDVDPRAVVGDLGTAYWQLTEIAKALSQQARVLIMDEPTAALTDVEIGELFRIIRQLRETGVGVVHISHRLEELKQISDRVTVMRDGHYVATVPTAEARLDQIISMMVGRTIFEEATEVPQGAQGEVVLDVRHLNRGRMVRDVSFELRRGEILGFAGLVGAGRTEVARAVFGADRADSGEIRVHGTLVRIASPADAVRLGIGYLSEDRKRFGLATGMDVESNVVLASLQRFVGWLGQINSRLTRSAAVRQVTNLAIKTPSIRQKVRNLSGGTQQKVVVGKWLTADTEILIFDEPTRGIDVGAKSEIYRLLNDLAREGKSIIMISSELPEILRMSHRIVVMCEGRITGVLPAGQATQEAIMGFATQRPAAA
jgi:ribose transport system ATP-binding protein